ncbi:hypothetical protein ACMHYO_17165 [Allopusillimonas ginsengisoli]|uniref:PBECR3 domain-containing polyvalent protein n=1 Tax=Allopusillimonas ginsengisoli TaxID=453575 RepID=UPI001485ACE1
MFILFGYWLSGYHHVIDSSSIRHVFKQHGNAAQEHARGQLPISASDFEAIPTVLARPDKLVFGTKNRIGRNQVVYIKRLDDGTTLYLEEVRTGRRELASQSMRKYPATMNVDRVISTLYPNAHSDGGNEPILMDGPDPRNIHDDCQGRSEAIWSGNRCCRHGFGAALSGWRR